MNMLVLLNGIHMIHFVRAKLRKGIRMLFFLINGKCFVCTIHSGGKFSSKQQFVYLPFTGEKFVILKHNNFLLETPIEIAYGSSKLRRPKTLVGTTAELLHTLHSDYMLKSESVASEDLKITFTINKETKALDGIVQELLY